MDIPFYWLGVIGKILVLLLLIRSTCELELVRLIVTVKWFDATCRHFFKVNISKLYLDCTLAPPTGSISRRPTVKPTTPFLHTKPPLRQRFIFWLLRFIAKHVELCVSKVEISVQDVVSQEVEFLGMVRVGGGVALLAQPMPDKMLAMSVEVEGAQAQLLMLSSKEEFVGQLEDGYSPLLEVEGSSRVYLYLQPLAASSSHSPLTSIQINTAPLSCTLLREGAFRYALQHVRSYLPPRRPAADKTQTLNSAKSLSDKVTKLPKVEIVLEDVSLLHQVRETNRVISSKLNRVSLNFGTSSVPESTSRKPAFSAMVALQDVTATDSLSREFLKLKQFRINSKYDSGQLSNMVKVESLHSTLREDETVYWTRYLLSSLRSFRPSDTTQNSTGSLLSRVGGSVTHMIRSMMSSAVTIAEATDWSVSMRMDTPTLQSKEPLVQAMLASCAANLQWSQLGPTQPATAAVIRASLRLDDSYIHVPGHAPSPSSDIFRQRPDDPSILPSLHKHQWGHLLALGNLTIKAEKTLTSASDSAVGKRERMEESAQASVSECAGLEESELASGTDSGVSKGEGLEESSQAEQPSPVPSVRETESGAKAVLSVLETECVWEEALGVLLGGQPVSVVGEGSSLMLEWSTATELSLLRTLQHLKQFYHLFGGPDQSAGRAGKEASKAGQARPVLTVNSAQNNEALATKSSVESATVSETEEVQGSFVGKLLSSLNKMAVSFNFTDINAFVYGLTPEPPSVMVRLDAVSISTPQPLPQTAPLSPSLQLNLHGLLLDPLSADSTSSPFLCSPLASLPAGVGVGVVNSLSLQYQHSLKEMSVNVSRVETNWSPTCHKSLFHTITNVWNGIGDLAAVVGWQLEMARQEADSQVILMGEKMSGVISRLPLSLAINMETAACCASLGQYSSVSVTVQTSHCLVKDRTLVADAYELGIVFDDHRIVTLENVRAVFPRENTAGQTERRKMKQMELDTNQAVDLSATRTKLIFPYAYNFGSTFDKLVTVRKYLAELHASGTGPSSLALSLPPDFHLQCGETFFQLCEDPFEAKLRANYELMCDEYEQKLDRLKALDEKVEELKQKQGEFNLSTKKIQSLYDSLVVKDCQIYCRRAQELHGSPDACRDELFVFSLERVQLWVMFDTSMLGQERLVDHIKDMDDISPFPEGKYDFSTLWGVYVSGDTDTLRLQLRDYPHPLLQGTNWSVCGRMVFVEQEAEERETRSAVVELGHPWKSVTMQRKLPPLKYYYDLKMETSTFVWSHGPCLEPALSQTNIALSLLSNPTVDPSRSLAYWDKFRLLFHGRIDFLSKEARILLPATFDPYNTVSYIELILRTLHGRLITNKQVELEGSLQAYVHNATRYDECELANFPHVKTCLTCHWVCAGKDPHNHHSVRRCAPDKIPVLPDKQEHDSYSWFRSHNVDVDWTLQALPQRETDPNPPSLLLFFSTLRWLQQYQVLLSMNVTRPIRKGTKWKVPRKRNRPPLLRHWRNLKIDVSFPKSVLTLWTSVAKQRGVECLIESGSASIAYLIQLTPHNDGLIRRPNRTWNVVSFSGNVKHLMAFIEKKEKISKTLDEDKEEESSDLLIANAHAQEVETEEEEEEVEEQTVRSILGYTAELSYKRQESKEEDTSESENFTHQLSMLNTRLLVTASNKQVVLGLYDSYKQAQMLKRDLSAEALKSLVTAVEPPLNTNTTAPAGVGEEASGGSGGRGGSPESRGSAAAGAGSRPGSARRIHRHSSSGNVMLDQLLKDLGNRLTVAEDTSSTKVPLKGVQLASGEDVRHKNWLITLTNIQVALKGIETSGYVVASSNKAQIFGQDHQPVLKEGDLVSKNSWLACVDKLQYFSTFGSMFEEGCVPWLPPSVISSPSPKKNRESVSVPRDSESSLNALLSQLGPADIRGEGEIEESSSREAMVGGLVNCLLIPAHRDTGRQELRGGAIQGASLQRIASRCQCSVIYVSYGSQVEPEGCDPALLTPEVASPGLNEHRSEAVDTITVTYPTVKICTTSEQQALIMDIITNLVLHKEPGKKEVLDQRAHMQFVVQLSDIQDPRKPVLVQQNKVRRCLQTIRSIERKVYFTQRQMETSDEAGEQRLEQELVELEAGLELAKEELSVATRNLRAMIRAFKESRLLPQPGQFTGVPEPVQRIEIWLDDAHWWLTQKDGQLEIADISITNFSYNRVSFSDDSGEHRLELGSFLVHNLTPNTPPIYQQVLVPYDPKSRRLRVDKNICLRVYCRDKARVAGITVREHLEVNVVPLQVSLTAKFFQTLQDFFFPKSEGDGPDPLEPDHSHLFGVHPTQSFGVDAVDGQLLQRGASSRRSTVSLSSSASHVSLQQQQQQTGFSPPASPGPSRDVQIRRGKHLSLSHLDTVKKMKERASHINTFIYVKIPQTTLCITYKGENWSYKDLQNQVMSMPTLEYHNRNWTWKDMLMEVKKDYMNAIIQQTLKNAIGMKESEESSGLASPKMLRASELLLPKTKPKNSKAGKGKKLFGKLSSTKEDSDSDKDSSSGSASPVYFPPLREPETNLKKTYRTLTKLSEEAQK